MNCCYAFKISLTYCEINIQTYFAAGVTAMMTETSDLSGNPE